MKVKIHTPKGLKTFYFDSSSTFEERKKIIEEEILKKYQQFIEENPKSYLRALMLRDCATFLLKRSSNSSVLKKQKVEEIHQKEIPLSQIKNKYLEQVLYSDYHVDDSENFLNKKDRVHQINSELFLKKKII